MSSDIIFDPIKYRSLVLILLCTFTSTTQATSLLESYKKAHYYDAQLKIARQDLAINTERKKQSLSPLLPQVGVQYGVNYTNERLNASGNQVIAGNPIPISNGKYTTETDRRGAQFQLSQPLFDLEKWYNYKGSQHANIGARANYIYQRYELITRVAEKYFNVAKAKSTLQTVQAEAKAIKENLRRVTLRYDEGVGTLADLRQAEASYDLVNARVIQSSNEYSLSQQALNAITGDSNPNVWTLSERFPITPSTLKTITEWKRLALRGNWQLRAAQYAISAAEDNVKAKTTKALPTINGALSYNKIENDSDNETFNTNIDSDISQQTAEINISLPLYTGGAISAAKRQSIAELKRKQHERTQLIRDINQAIDRSFTNAQTLISQIKAYQRSIQSTQAALRTTQFSYQNGTQDFSDVLQAQNALYSARRDYSQARYDYLISLLHLKHYSGQLRVQDLIDINKWLVAP